MVKLTLTHLASLTNEQSAINTLNENFDDIEDAIENTYSRNGLAPNTMSANLDMNSFRILNLAAPVDDNDPVRLVDVVEGIQGEQGEPGTPGGPIADGDYGDIVVSSSGTVFTLDSGVVTTAAKTVLDDTSVSAMRTTLGLGNSATKDVGTSSTTVAAGDDARF